MIRHDETAPVLPACRATVGRLQLVLDGEVPADSLDADPHPVACLECRERVAAARILLAMLAAPAEPTPLPAGLTANILDAVREDRYARSRHRSYAVSVGVVASLAASILVLLWFVRPPQEPSGFTPAVPDVAKVSGPGTPGTPVAPEHRPVRIGEELSKAGLALRDAPRPFGESAALAPAVFGTLTDALMPPAPEAEMDPEPARAALADLPAVTKTGLEPVTGTAQKAFARLLRDVGAVAVKPKS